MSALTAFFILCCLVTVALGMASDRSFLIEGLAIAMTVFTLVTAVVGGVGALARTGCRESARQMNVEHSWGYLKGCFFLIDGRWVPEDAYRGTEDVSR